MLEYLRRVFGGPRKPSHPALTQRQIETAWTIVESWGEFCEYDTFSGQIRDETSLPFPKAAIRNALLIVAGVERDPEVIAALPVVANALAYFQPDIGEKPLWSTGSDMAALVAMHTSANTLGISIGGDTLVAALQGDPDNKARYGKLIAGVREEAELLQEQLDRIAQSRA